MEVKEMKELIAAVSAANVDEFVKVNIGVCLDLLFQSLILREIEVILWDLVK